MQMVEKTIPWWRKALEIALGGLRSGFGFFPRPANPEPVTEAMFSGSTQESPEEETTLIEPSRKAKNVVAAPAIPAEPAPAAKPVQATRKGWDKSKRAEKPPFGVNARVDLAESAESSVGVEDPTCPY